MDSFYIHVGGVRVRLDLPYGARDPIGAHGMDELKAERMKDCFRALEIDIDFTQHWSN